MSNNMIQLKLPFPPPMTTMRAIEIIDNFEGVHQIQDLYAAYQFLIDTNQVWSLQGRYGRMAKELIMLGLCTAPQTNNQPYSCQEIPCKLTSQTTHTIQQEHLSKLNMPLFVFQPHPKQTQSARHESKPHATQRVSELPYSKGDIMDDMIIFFAFMVTVSIFMLFSLGLVPI